MPKVAINIINKNDMMMTKVAINIINKMTFVGLILFIVMITKIY